MAIPAKMTEQIKKSILSHEITQEITRDLLFVGSSRATLKLELLILDDVAAKIIQWYGPLGEIKSNGAKI
jgi:hypothetical protein